jgi:hypothetical protein
MNRENKKVSINLGPIIWDKQQILNEGGISQNQGHLPILKTQENLNLSQ